MLLRSFLMRSAQLCTALSSLILGVLLFAFPPANAAIPVPQGQEAFAITPSVAVPLISSVPSQAAPIGIGTVAAGGSLLDIVVGVGQFTAPVDIYFAIYVPAIDPVNIYLLTPAGLQTFAQAGIVPWLPGTSGSITIPLLQNLPTAQLPSGTYTLFLLVTPTGTISTYYLWQTSFTLQNRVVVFSYPPNPSGGLIQSSWADGSDQNVYAYDDFTLASTDSITEIDWRGGYIHSAQFGRVTDFTVTIFGSKPGLSQPNAPNPQLPEAGYYLAKYTVGGNAGETPAGTSGMYDYKFVLPTPFQAVAGTKYWLRIEASQPTYPDWGIAVGTGGDGQYFRFSTGSGMFQVGSEGDTAFTLLR